MNTQQALERSLDRMRELRREGVGEAELFQSMEQAVFEFRPRGCFSESGEKEVQEVTGFTAVACLLLMLIDEPEPMVTRSLAEWLAAKENEKREVK